MHISEFLETELQRGTVELTGIANGVQEFFLDQNKGAGVIHYTGFLIDSDREQEGRVFIYGSMDCYLGEHKNLQVLSMLKASAETREPVTITGDIMEKEPYEIFVTRIKFGKYENDQA